MQSQPLSPGARVGRYEIIAHIASGGMGAVYKARDVELDRTVALKVLPGAGADNPVMLERFRREARNAARLSHRNVVTLYDWGQDGGTWFLALEFVDGIDLGSHIAVRGQLEPQEAWLITVQAARALDHAFQQGITHRDIKPSNFLLARRGNKFRLKLTDLGLARAVHEDEFRVTRDGTTVGTIDYMSPEQGRDSALADVRSDIYSLGCTLYHMLAGRPPFAEGGLGERLFKHMQAEPADVRQFNPDVPDGLWAVLQRMLAKQPEDRYQTPAELLDTLLSLGVPGGAPPGAPAAAAVSDIERRAALAAVEWAPGGSSDSTPTRRSRPTPHASPTAPSLAVVTAAVVGISAEQRAAAAAQFKRVLEVLGSDEAEKGEVRELLLSCCRLDPANIGYRRTLRQVGRKLRRRGEVPLGLEGARDRLEAARQTGDSLKVLEHGEEVLAVFPLDVATHVNMAEAAAELNLPELHAWLLKQACKQDPANVELRRGLARAYERQKQLGKAIAVWREIRKVHPEDTEATCRLDALLRLLAWAYEEHNDRDSAVAVWEAVLKLRPEDDEAQRQICDLLLETGSPRTDDEL
jgi:serine/threonine protein kinase